jgi:hypothetical protein
MTAYNQVPPQEGPSTLWNPFSCVQHHLYTTPQWFSEFCPSLCCVQLLSACLDVSLLLADFFFSLLTVLWLILLLLSKRFLRASKFS